MLLTENTKIRSADEPFVSLIYDHQIEALISCTYSKDTQNRSGQIRILDCRTLEDLFSVSLPSAAFHLEHNEDADLYIAGLGDGQIAFFNAQTRQLTTDKPFTSRMVTDAKLSTTNQRVAFTDEAGALRVYDRSNSAVIFDRTNAHSMCGQPVNAWSCEFLNDNLVASGGDDNLLKIWDLRDGGQRPIQLNKSHSGGVVRLIKLNEQLCTGSYDEKLRFFDLRSLNEPSTCVEFGGGVWDFKFDDQNRRLFIANMYNGFSILDADTLEVVHSREMPDELIYGVTANADMSSIYCCSFTSGFAWSFDSQ